MVCVCLCCVCRWSRYSVRWMRVLCVKMHYNFSENKGKKGIHMLPNIIIYLPFSQCMFLVLGWEHVPKIPNTSWVYLEIPSDFQQKNVQHASAPAMTVGQQPIGTARRVCLVAFVSQNVLPAIKRAEPLFPAVACCRPHKREPL